MEEIAVCRVNVYLNDTSNLIYESEKGLNEAEIKAIGISKSIYCNSGYYDINSIAFNFEDYNSLDIFVNE